MEDFKAEEALERVDNDLELLDELVSVCESDFNIKIEEIKVALAASNCKSVYEIAHSLKSAFGNLAATKAFHASKDVEFAGRGQKLEELPALVDKFEEAARAFFSAYGEYKVRR